MQPVLASLASTPASQTPACRGPWIAVYIPQLLRPLPRTPHIEIIEARLPHMPRSMFKQVALRGISPRPALRQHPSCKPQPHRLHHGGGRAILRLADQKMNVLGHDHIAHYHKLVALPHAFQYRQEQIPPPHTAQPPLPLVTTAGDEMQISCSIVASQTGGHAQSG